MADLHCLREIVEREGEKLHSNSTRKHGLTYDPCTCTDVIGLIEQIWQVDKISILLTLDCRISAKEDLSHKSLESRIRASVHFRTN